MQAPRLAVTTVLLRAGATGVEVLLVHRPKTMRAFGDMWVFPGGQVDAADGTPEALACLSERQLACPAAPFLAPDEGCPDPPVLPLFTAALRELFEEVGVLLAASPEGSPTGSAEARTLARQREALLADATTFYRELAARRLTLAVERLEPWSRWITPPDAGRRFDTVFFVAVLAAGTALLPHAAEIDAARWLPLHAVAAEALRRERILMSPTLLTLLQLSESLQVCGALADLFSRRATGLITPVRSKMIVIDGESWIVFPWDANDGKPGSHGWRDFSAASTVPGRILSLI